MTTNRPDRYTLHKMLDRHLDDVERLFDGATGPHARSGWANVLTHDLLGIVAQVAGRELLEAAYGPNPDSDDASAVLQSLAHRIFLASELFASLENYSGPHPSSLIAASHELRAIAAGDAPRIFAQHEAAKGHRTNAYRLALRQLAAFEWEAFLSERRDSVAARRAEISRAFGAQWDTIRKWRAPISLLLGSGRVEAAERYARLTAQEGWPLRGRAHDDGDALSADGRAYQDELRRQSKSLEK